MMTERYALLVQTMTKQEAQVATLALMGAAVVLAWVLGPRVYGAAVWQWLRPVALVGGLLLFVVTMVWLWSL